MTTIDPKLRQALAGISGILVTPFDAQDRLAPARLKPVIDRAIKAGVHILVINGNTSEFYGLTTAEAETMVQAAAEQIAGRVPLIAGVGRSINDACALARASRAAGASALMVHQPPDPFVSPRGVVAYVLVIACGLRTQERQATRRHARHVATACTSNRLPGALEPARRRQSSQADEQVVQRPPHGSRHLEAQSAPSPSGPLGLPTKVATEELCELLPFELDPRLPCDSDRARVDDCQQRGALVDHGAGLRGAVSRLVTIERALHDREVLRHLRRGLVVGPLAQTVDGAPTPVEARRRHRRGHHFR